MHLGRIAAKLASTAMVGLLAMTLSSGTAGAQEPLTLIDGTPDGVHLTTTASADFEPVADAETLLLDGVTIGSCTMAWGLHPEGPILILAEAGAVTVHRSGGSAGFDFQLEQGDSIIIPADYYFYIVNNERDAAFQASVLILTLTNTTRDGGPIEVNAKFEHWDDGSACQGPNDHAKIETRFSVRGRAAAGATRLYLGLGTWEPGATTEGYELASESASFNLLLLTGGMPTAGQNSGRAVQFHPGQVASDSPADSIEHYPFENPGSAPVTGIIFGTTANNQPVFVAN